MNDAISQFKEAIQSADMEPPEVIEPGRWHRFPGMGKKKGNKAGWCKLFPDLLAGVYGDFSRGLTDKWVANQGERLSPQENAALREQVNDAKEQMAREQAKAQQAAAKRAFQLWQSANPADSEHPYLIDKGIQAHGIRQLKTSLVIPLYNEAGYLCSLQFIKPNGFKRFLSGGRIAGCYHRVGRQSDTICLAEGYATAASIHEATGYPVAVAFNAGNIKPVAKSLRSRLPNVRLIICADNDVSNTGQEKAQEAAAAVSGEIVIPPKAGDWNDYAKSQGLGAVRSYIDKAVLPDISFRRLSEVEAEPINWLWPGRIAKGKATMIAGDPGLGKSQISASLAAIVSTGGLWPVDRTKADAGSVIILSAEDDAADTIKPRLEAAGADVSRCYTLDAIIDRKKPRTFNMAKDLQHLGNFMMQIGDVSLVIIDPISAYLGGTDSHKNADVRALLSPLGDLAIKHRTAIVCVSHLNKSGGTNALSRVTGSLAFVAAARAAYVVAKDPEDDSRRLFLPAKNNIGPDGTGLAYHIESAEFNGIETSRINWHNEQVTVTADQALGSSGGEERSATDETTEWLESLLRQGPMAARDIQREAKEAGITEKALRTARKHLGIKPTKLEFAGGWRWALPGSCPQDAQDAQPTGRASSGIFDDQGQRREVF